MEIFAAILFIVLGKGRTVYKTYIWSEEIKRNMMDNLMDFKMP
jgi:hypothetical protein